MLFGQVTPSREPFEPREASRHPKLSTIDALQHASGERCFGALECFVLCSFLCVFSSSNGDEPIFASRSRTSEHVITCLSDLVLEAPPKSSFARLRNRFIGRRSHLSGFVIECRLSPVVQRGRNSFCGHRNRLKATTKATKKNSLRFIEQKHERFWLTVRYDGATQ